MAEPEILFDRRGAAGIVTLNRPAALNALTLNMVRLMHRQLDRWAGDSAVAHVVVLSAGDRAFCAGGDIRQLYEWGLARDPAFLDFYREEYQLNALIKRYPKPYIAIMDGITMGGGVGVSVHGSHRISTERLTFAMPETGIGLFPDVGGSYFLPRCPGRLGMFMGLTGHRLKAADAAYAGIATHHVDSARIAGLVEDLAKAETVAQVLDTCPGDLEGCVLATHRRAIDEHFAQPSVAEIIASLDRGATDWSAATARILRQKSPTSLLVTYRQLTRGAHLSFEDCMRMEFRIVHRIFTGHDFFEGTRAVVIDKDQAPNWEPASLDDISSSAIDAYFEKVSDELPLTENS